MGVSVVRPGKPTRIFYSGDFDPAGDSMPVAVAHQIEFWLQDYTPGADINSPRLPSHAIK